MTLSMAPHPRSSEEGFLYMYDPDDLPEGAQRVKARVTDDVEVYGIRSAAGLVEVFACHRLWGPSDARRGEIHTNLGDIVEVSRAEWERVVNNV